MLTLSQITQILDAEAEDLLTHTCSKIYKTQITTPKPGTIEKNFSQSDRPKSVLKNLKKLYGTGRLANTGYLSILPIDQGIEHTAAYSFYKNPLFFDPKNIVKLAIEAGCNGVASTLGVLGLMSKKYADKVAFIVKINHNELLTYPTKHDQHVFSSVEQAYNLGAAAVGATIYFGSKHSNRQIEEISAAFERAHELGLATILWCYPRNAAFRQEKINHETAADISGQACHLGVTIEADIIKQKIPTHMDGMRQLDFCKYSDAMYDKLLTNHPIDMVRFQVANCYMGRIGLLNSGGSSGKNDLQAAIKTAVINKRAGGTGLIMGRKAFSRPIKDGVKILQAVQDVYLNKKVTIA